jgi:hypothetical protein
MEFLKENEPDYYIESYEVRIEDASTGEGYYLFQQLDRGDCGFIKTDEPPTPLPVSLENKLNSLWQMAFNDQNEVVKPTFKATGKWFQGQSVGEMEIDLTIENEVIFGKGEDNVGHFEINGYLFNKYLTFKKAYVNKHSLVYFGNRNSQNGLFEGEWFITRSGTQGTFELQIPNH